MDKNGKTILNGRYEIIRPIGYGGMAEVFLAHDQLLDRNVAVKMLRDQFLEDNELLEQFRREAKSAARLVHPYIINIYDVVSEGSNQYIVMEYVDGVTLKEYMQEHKLSLNTVLEIAVRLADAKSQSTYMRREKIENIVEIRNLYKQILMENQCVTLRQLAVSGRELMELGMKPGRELGAMLSELLEYVLDDPERNTKENLCKYVKEKIEKEK